MKKLELYKNILKNEFDTAKQVFYKTQQLLFPLLVMSVLFYAFFMYCEGDIYYSENKLITAFAGYYSIYSNALFTYILCHKYKNINSQRSITAAFTIAAITYFISPKVDFHIAFSLFTDEFFWLCPMGIIGTPIFGYLGYICFYKDFGIYYSISMALASTLISCEIGEGLYYLIFKVLNLLHYENEYEFILRITGILIFELVLLFIWIVMDKDDDKEINNENKITDL